MNRVSLGILLLLKINNIFSVNITCLKIIIKHKKNTPTVFYYLANNTDGNTPFHLACDKGYNEIIDYFSTEKAYFR